ncbi:MAG: serine proteinase [Oscillospiraceae bacterium]|nr:serine proteinase [Oscillospiraceae bacterium]
MAINFDELKDKAVDVAQSAAQKTKELAAIAKAKLSIVAEEDKIRKAQIELGKLYYRDYVLSEEMDSAEYLPWCDKITESKAVIEDLQDMIDDIKNGTCCVEEEEETEAPAEE